MSGVEVTGCDRQGRAKEAQAIQQQAFPGDGVRSPTLVGNGCGGAVFPCCDAFQQERRLGSDVAAQGFQGGANGLAKSCRVARCLDQRRHHVGVRRWREIFSVRCGSPAFEDFPHRHGLVADGHHWGQQGGAPRREEGRYERNTCHDRCGRNEGQDAWIFNVEFADQQPRGRYRRDAADDHPVCCHAQAGTRHQVQ
jgi:hypothetical protein